LPKILLHRLTIKVEMKSEEAMSPGRKLPKNITGVTPSVLAAKTDFLPPTPLLPLGAQKRNCELETASELNKRKINQLRDKTTESLWRIRLQR
jgi:hypothetical protein